VSAATCVPEDPAGQTAFAWALADGRVVGLRVGSQSWPALFSLAEAEIRVDSAIAR
jgi:hypothetical protein